MVARGLVLGLISAWRGHLSLPVLPSLSRSKTKTYLTLLDESGISRAKDVSQHIKTENAFSYYRA